ncbi:conserved hypothetical protein [Culex quinquefasciatus]|uniref:Uncharacterized protein n=1 Tax=Culex quinquefasciatus TaxID=7176 RepID=B0X0I8_CULQU|nr:conserved hypothetical protein [Culex quinquefasciatus]|eukprot:XP_001863160.1 conserved hypothetical protein [Culex quinquefasciatus]
MALRVHSLLDLHPVIVLAATTSALRLDLLHLVLLLVQLELDPSDRSRAVAVPNELVPVGVLLERFRVADHNEKCLGPCQCHVETLHVVQKADAARSRPDRGEYDDGLFTTLERFDGTDLDRVPAVACRHLLELDALLFVRGHDADVELGDGATLTVGKKNPLSPCRLTISSAWYSIRMGVRFGLNFMCQRTSYLSGSSVSNSTLLEQICEMTPMTVLSDLFGRV